jgi:type I restriction enzyme S subunit
VEQLREPENPPDFPDALFRHFSIPAFDESQAPRSEPGENIKSLKSRVPPGAVLLSKLNPEIERVWLVDVEPGDRAVCSTEFLVLRARPPYGRSYAYCLARSAVFRQQIEALVTGTSKSHQRAQAGAILDLTVILPPAQVADAFDSIASALLDRTLQCRRESRTLAAVRDAMLPKLISGELRLRAAEHLIKDVV